MKNNINKTLISFFAVFALGFSQDNYSLSFDGVDDYVFIGDNQSLDLISEEFTFLATVKFAETSAQGYILSKRYYSAGAGYEIRVSNNTIYVEVNPGGGAIALTAPIEADGYFHTIVATFKNQEHFRLFLDGELVDDFGINATIGTETNFSIPSLTNDQNLVIGEFSAMDGRGFNGLINKISISNISMSLEEVETMFEDIDYNLSENLVAFWPFNEGEGNTLTDLSGNDNHGTISGASWSTDVPELPVPPTPGGNNSLSFDGVDDYAFVSSTDLDNIFSGYNPFTVSLWVFGNDLEGDMWNSGTLFGKGNVPNENDNPRSVMLVDQGWAVSFMLYSGITDFIGSHASMDILDPGVWNSITVSYDGGTTDNSLRFYKNGTLFDDVSYQSNGSYTGVNQVAQPFYIGSKVKDNGTPHIQLYGLMDEVTVWDRALSNQEIQSYFSVSPAGNEDGLYGYWNLNEGEGSVLNDLSDYGNNGTVVGATWSGNSAPVEPPVLGCMDPYADNFDPDANTDDGSCSGYPDNGEYSLSFDSDNVNVGEIGDYSSQVTVMAWLKTTDGGSYHAIVSGSCGNIMLTMNEDKLLFGSQCSQPIEHDTYGTTELNDGVWHHVAATYDENGGENNLRVYVDGVLEGQSTKTGQFVTGDFTIASAPAPGEYIDGNLDMVRIWNAALTQEQIQENMNSSAPSVESDLLADWRVNAGEGNILYDHSGNQNHGTINGATWSEDVYVPPVPPVPGGNNSLSFDGVDDYVDLTPIDLSSSDQMTLMCWINAADITTDSENTIIRQDWGEPNWLLQISDYGTNLNLNIEDISGTNFDLNYAISPADIENGWHFISGVCDGNNMHLYLDGELVASQPFSGENIGFGGNNQTTYLNIGKHPFPNTNAESFDGLIDEVSIWNTALPEVHIQYYMSTSPGGNEGQLVGYWNFNEGEGSTLTDLSGNGNNGTINGATWSGDVYVPPVYGCMDTYAENYSLDATADDGSCSYPDNGNYSLSFDGETSGVSGTASSSLDVSGNNRLTFSAWVKPSEDLENSGVIFAHTNNFRWHQYALIVNPDGRLYFISGLTSFEAGGNNLSNGQIPLGDWSHITLTYDGTAVRFYINGENDFTHNVEDTFGTEYMGDFHIGHADGDSRYNGLMDEISVWNSALNEEQIQANMSSELNGDEPGLVGHWSFNTGEGDIVYDRSGNSNHGTISDAGWSENIPYAGPEWFVSTDGDDSNNGSIDQPFASIQQGIDAANNGDTVHVAAGTYVENINYNGKNIAVIGVDKETTVIDGNQSGSVVTILGNNNSAKLKGFTITNGEAGLFSGLNSYCGGGVFVAGNMSVMLTDLIIHNNSSQDYGAGIAGFSNDLQIFNSIIHDNSSSDGGGIYIGNSQNVQIRNNIFYGNSATDNGGGLSIQGSNIQIDNCTIFNNENHGLFLGLNSTVNIRESALSNNSLYEIKFRQNNGTADLYIEYSFIEDEQNSIYINGYGTVTWGEGNIESDPLFCNVSNGDFTLAENSPLINAGEFGSDIGAFGIGCEEPFNNYSLSFDGDGDYVDCDNGASLNVLDNFTIEANINWVSGDMGYVFHKWSNSGGIGIQIIGPGGYYDLNYNSLCLWVYASGSWYSFNTPFNSIQSNEWHHIATTYEDGGVALYIDGAAQEVSQNSDISGPIEDHLDETLAIGGKDIGYGPHYFNGYIDEVAVWNVILDQEEIQSQMNQELTGTEEGLVGYWNFNAGEGEMLTDQSGNGNNGQVNGATWATGAPLDPAPSVYGCNDPYAENFDPNANTNDGSCDYSQEPVTFTKENYTDPMLAENQDRITASVWITRGDSMSLYNAVLEEYYADEDVSPEGTLWAPGFTAFQLSLDNYQAFKQTTGGNHQSLPGRTMSMHIVGTELFYDVEIHSWTVGADGGGFSYTRSPAELNSFEYPEDTVYFEKEDYADWQLEESQDRITEDTWLTRGIENGIFNAFSEQNYESGSPENTVWSFGRTDSLSVEDYISWEAASDSNNIIGQFMSLHILSENIYFDVVFHSWTGGANGGGFSYTRMPVDVDTGPMVNGSISGVVTLASDSSLIEGAHIVAVAENNSYSAESYSDSSGSYNLDLVGSLNYYVNISYDSLIDHNEYLFVAPFENTVLDVSLGVLEDALVEGSLTDWYTNAPLSGASVLFAYTDEGGDMETIETTTDESGYFMAQVPGEQDYDLFLYAEDYWVEHDAFFLGSAASQVISVGIAPMSSASRLYGTIRDFETGELVPYAEVQLNCESASDWDHTGELGTYRVFNYYAGDCDNGVLVVSASGYETSVQSVGAINFETGSSVDLDVTLAMGNDPDPGMLSGAVYSNIDESPIEGASISAYNISTTQLFSVNTSDNGSYQLFLPESDYYVSVNADNHEELFDTLSIVSGQSHIKDFNLDQVYLNTLSGTITDQSGVVLQNIEVVAIVDGGTIVSGTFTDENGYYEIYLLNGTYDIVAGTNNYHTQVEYGVEIIDTGVTVDLVLEQVQQFDGGVAGIVHLNDADTSQVMINVRTSGDDLSYNAYVTSDASGAYALPLINGTYNLRAWVPGSDYESVYVLNAFTVDNSVVSFDIYFIAPDGPEAPIIVFLEDVANDQGGQMDLAWSPGSPQEFEIFPRYSVWRQDDEWTLLASVPFHGFNPNPDTGQEFEVYSMVVPTLGDSTDDGIVESTFMVTAHTIDPNIFFDSDPATGYSVDNIFPAVPDQLLATFSGETVELDWSAPTDNDFAYFNIYRQDLGSSDAAAVFSSEENFYTDEVGYLGEFEYWVTAVDLSGNESDPSGPTTVTLALVSELMPSEFALQQNYPNPFNPSTQIRYALPKSSNVKIVVYNMLGSKVRTLYSGLQDAGFRSVLWNATNDQGDPVSAGVYIYTIETNGYYASKKMILLK